MFAGTCSWYEYYLIAYEVGQLEKEVGVKEKKEIVCVCVVIFNIIFREWWTEGKGYKEVQRACVRVCVCVCVCGESGPSPVVHVELCLQ